MCIRDRIRSMPVPTLRADKPLVGTGMERIVARDSGVCVICLLYTSDAADERSSGDLGGRRIIKKNKKCKIVHCSMRYHTTSR